MPHWQAWLAQELVLRDTIVAFPQLRDAHAPQKEVWVRQALDAFKALSPDVVVCHSLGSILWLHLCAHLETHVPKLLLVAPPRDHSDTPEVATFFPTPLPLDLHAHEALMVVSNSDPYMSIEESHTLAKALDIPLEILHEAGHINTAAGFGAWEWALEWVLAK